MRAATMGSQADYLGEMEGLPGCTTSSICSPTQLSSALFKQAALVAAQAQQVSGSPLSQRSAGVVQAASTAAAVSTDLQTANSAAVPLAAAEGGRSHHAQPPSCRAEEGSPSGRPGRLVVPKLLLKGLCRPEEPFQVAKPDSEALDDPSIISFGWSANDDAVLLLELEDLLQVEVQESDVHAVLGGSTGRMPREELVRMLRARLLPPSPAVSTSLHLCTPLAAIAEEDSTACCSVSISCSVNSSMAAWSVVERRATGGAFSPISASAGSITSLTSPSAVRSPTSPSTLTWLQNQLRRSGSFDASQLARPEPRSQGPQAGAWAAPDAPVSSSTSDTLQAGSDQFASHSRRLAPIATTRPPSYQQDKPQLPGYLPAQQQSDTWTSDSTGSRLRQGRKLRPGLQQQQHRAVGGNLRSHPLPGNLWWYTEHEDLLPEDSATAQKLLVPQLFSGRHQALMERLSWLGNGAYSSVYMGYIERQPVVIKVIDLVDPSTSEDAFPAVLQEAAVMEALAGVPGTAQLLDCGTWRGKYVLLMPHYGVNLARWRSKQGDACSERTVLQLFQQILFAVHAMHRAGVVHLDLKPHNVFLSGLSRTASSSGDAAPRVVVGDMGSALMLAQCATCREARGTEAYMAPEMLLTGECSEAADVWSLGCLLYFLLNNRPLSKGGMDSVWLEIEGGGGSRPLLMVLLKGMLQKEWSRRFTLPKCSHIVQALLDEIQQAAC